MPFKMLPIAMSKQLNTATRPNTPKAKAVAQRFLRDYPSVEDSVKALRGINQNSFDRLTLAAKESPIQHTKELKQLPRIASGAIGIFIPAVRIR